MSEIIVGLLIFLLVLLIFAPVIVGVGRYLRERREDKEKKNNATESKKNELDNLEARKKLWDKKFHDELNYVDPSIENLFDIIEALYHEYGIDLYYDSQYNTEKKLMRKNEREHVKEGSPLFLDNYSALQLPIIQRIENNGIYGDHSVFNLYQELLQQLANDKDFTKYKTKPKKNKERKQHFTIKDHKKNRMIICICVGIAIPVVATLYALFMTWIIVGVLGG